MLGGVSTVSYYRLDVLREIGLFNSIDDSKQYSKMMKYDRFEVVDDKEVVIIDITV